MFIQIQWKGGFRFDLTNDSFSFQMEVSAPVKILEGDSEVIGVTIGTIPGSGDCAAITSFSAVNLYSMDDNNIIATWTFPSNTQERISSPAYIVNDSG